MAPPKSLPEVREFRQQALGACAFHGRDQPAEGDLGWERDHDMDMIRRDMAWQDIDPKAATLLPHHRPDAFRYFAAQGLVTVLGDPDDMEVDRKGGMGAMAVVTHAPESTENLLKLPPKGGGFNPPNWRQ
jgi:hypothetical protein